MSESNLVIYSNRYQVYYDSLTYIFLAIGLVAIPITLILLISCASLISPKIKPNILISLFILTLDFITISSFLGMSIVSLIDGELLPKNSWLCNFNDLLYIGTTYYSAWLVALLTVERSIQLTLKLHFTRKFWLILIFLEFLYFYTPNLISISFNEIGLADLGIYCMSTPIDSVGYFTICWYGVIMTLSNLTVIYSYSANIFYYWKQMKLAIELGTSKTLALKNFRTQIAKEIAFLILYLAGNGLEWYNTWGEVITVETRTVKMDFISTCLMNFNPFINNLLFITVEPPVKQALLSKFPVLKKIMKFEDKLNNSSSGEVTEETK